MVELHAGPAGALVDECVRIRVTGLQSRQLVTIRSTTQPFGASARATFVAEADGSVDVSSQAPVEGDYLTCDPMGLFWAAQLAPEVDFGVVLDCHDSLTPLETTIVATVAGVDEAVAVLTRQPHAPDVQRVPVRAGRVRATLFLPPGARDLPAVIVVGGSSGGCYELPAALLASRGFVTLALAYFGYQDLPAQLAEIPLEYFQEAIGWLRAQPAVAPTKIGVLGQSRGGELALLLGATFPEIAAVVALVPSAVLMGPDLGDPASVPASWTLGGRSCQEPLVVPFDEDWTSAMLSAAAGGSWAGSGPLAGTPMTVDAIIRADPLALDRAMIPVEKTCGPILLVSGEQDEMWPSVQLAELAVRRLADHGFSHPVEHLRYAGAGHTAAIAPYFPTTRNWLAHSQFPFPMAIGGEPGGTATAQVAAAEQILRFLSLHLA